MAPRVHTARLAPYYLPHILRGPFAPPCLCTLSQALQLLSRFSINQCYIQLALTLHACCQLGESRSHPRLLQL